MVKKIEERRMKCREFKHFVRTDDLDDVRTKHLQRELLREKRSNGRQRIR
jgi:hypothetical protein